MPVDSILLKCRRDIQSRTARTLVSVSAAVVLCLPLAALAQSKTVCGPEIKAYVAQTLAGAEDASEQDKLGLEAELYDKYKSCLQDVQLYPVPSTFYVAARECGAKVSNLGSLFFEQMSCCGYDPQRRQFACPVQIKHTIGYGPQPLPGSREHVLHCVADPTTGVLLPVGHDSVHLADAIPGQVPTWQFAVIANANDNLYTIQPMSGQTRVARSILSWGLRPTGCNYQPIWGNALNYRIRLDQ